MTQVREITEREYTSQEVPKQSKLTMALMLARVLLRNPAILKNVMVMGPDEERWIRPPREYEIPPFRESMKHCTANETYLRPTRWCNPREPEVIAMANQLGAYELSDYEFADAAYWFVKTKIAGEMLPLDSVGATLRRGTGTCIHLTSLWIALCRAAGIKARYKTFKSVMDDVVGGMGLDVTQMMALGETDLEETEQAMLPDMMNMMPGGHAEGEACIDGKWVVADTGMPPEMQAAAGIPIMKFGEDAIDSTEWRLIPGSIERLESLPLMIGIQARALMRLVPAAMERSSIALAGMIPLGRKVIEEAGGIEAYDRNARRRRKLFSEDEITRKIKQAERPQVVVFEE